MFCSFWLVCLHPICGHKIIQLPNHRQQPLFCIGVINEVVEMPESVDHHVQPIETEEADRKNLHELTQEVTIDDSEHNIVAGTRRVPLLP